MAIEIEITFELDSGESFAQVCEVEFITEPQSAPGAVIQRAGTLLIQTPCIKSAGLDFIEFEGSRWKVANTSLNDDGTFYVNYKQLG